MVWIPAGFGHGFAALTETVALSYKVTDYYRRKRSGLCFGTIRLSD